MHLTISLLSLHRAEIQTNMGDETPAATPPHVPPPMPTPPTTQLTAQSVSPAPPQKEDAPPPSAPQVSESAETEKKEPPHSEQVVSVSDSLDIPEKEKVEEPPAPTIAASESNSHTKEEEKVEPQPQLPEAVALESISSLAAMLGKDKPAPEPAEKSVVVITPTTTEDGAGDQKKIPQKLVSFKEESNKWADLSEFERKSLQELKQLVQEALETHQFAYPPPEASKIDETPETQNPIPAKEVSIWGIPLLQDDRSDVILLKFLRARDFKVKEAFTMIKNTIRWRKQFGIDELVDEDLGDDLQKVVFMQRHDREVHPVCYNLYGEFQNKELYQKTFADEEKRNKFLKWRIQFLERSIRKLDFSPGGISTIFQVNDLRNSPGTGKRELRLATKQALQLLQDNYPEFVARQVFINVPWWYLAYYTMISPFMTPRTKSKFVFAGPSKTAETLFKFISPEQVPVQYGGLSVDYCDCNPEFSIDDSATEMIVKPGRKQTVEIAIYEKCVIVWELQVVGWEVSYGAEFVPDSKNSYTVIIQKATKMARADEVVVSQSFKVSELGKILLTVDNPTSKKKKLLYRFKVKPFL